MKIGSKLFLLASAFMLPALAEGFEIPRFGAQTGRVLLHATARDAKGRPVLDLRSDEVRVFENGRLQKIDYFSLATDTPARVLVLVDASGSMQAEAKMTSVLSAVTQIVSRLEARDEIALAGFDDHYFGLTRFTRDHASILAALGKLEWFGSTALYDAVEEAVRDAASRGDGRRAIVILTDGIDTASRLGSAEALARSRALDVPIYALSVVSPLNDPKSRQYVGDKIPPVMPLDAFVEGSGGAALIVSDAKGLQSAVERILNELKHQYRLSYDPPASGRGFQRIELRTTRKGVVLKTRRGYTR